MSICDILLGAMRHENNLVALVKTLNDLSEGVFSTMMKTIILFLVATLTSADIIYDNEVIKTEEIFELDYARDSDLTIYDNDGRNATYYYCTFRSNWNAENHPAQFPKAARWGSALMYSHTKQYVPFLKNREAPYGVEQIAEVSGTQTKAAMKHELVHNQTFLLIHVNFNVQETFNDPFKKELVGEGSRVKNFTEGETFFLNQDELKENFKHLPPLKVSAEHSYISGINGFSPSPDWFTGFYLFNTVKDEQQTFWESFMLKSFPWDAGTNDGDTYEAPSRDTDPPLPIVRIDVENTQNEIFKSPLGDKVRHLAEWECVLHTCPIEEPECVKPDWPPANGCDILRYPLCATPCDPKVDQECEQCKRKSNNEAKVYHANCCDAGREPEDGICEEEANGEANGSGVNTQGFIFTAMVTAGGLLAALL